MDIHQLQTEVEERFPPENYGVKNALKHVPIEIDAFFEINVLRDGAKKKRWLDCLDVARGVAELTKGNVIQTKDRTFGLYHECHFVCNAKIGQKTMRIDGTPLFPFSKRRDWYGREYDGEQTSLCVSKGLTPFSFKNENGRMYHSLIHLVPELFVKSGISEGMYAAYACLLFEDGKAKQLVGRRYFCEDVTHSHEFQKNLDNVFEIEPYDGTPLFRRRKKCESADETLMDYVKVDEAHAIRFMEKSAKALYDRVESMEETR